MCPASGPAGTSLNSPLLNPQSTAIIQLLGWSLSCSMAPYSLVVLGLLVASEASSIVARPTADVETVLIESNMIEPEQYRYASNELKPSYKPDWKKFLKVLEIVEIGRQLAQRRRNEVTTAFPSTTADDSTSKPIYGPERLLDRLLDHTGEKQPMFHSALDGWVF